MTSQYCIRECSLLAIAFSPTMLRGGVVSSSDVWACASGNWKILSILVRCENSVIILGTEFLGNKVLGWRPRGRNDELVSSNEIRTIVMNSLDCMSCMIRNIQG